jgi:asparagine synthase (glutamine-hydrolysing)
MAFSVEARVPFLDYRLIEYAFGKGAPWRIRDGWTKWLLREAMRDKVPAPIVWRRDKVGFETPERKWMREWLGNDPTLFKRDDCSAEFLAIGHVNDAVQRWVRDGQGDGRRIWRWVNLAMWLRRKAA